MMATLMEQSPTAPIVDRLLVATGREEGRSAASAVLLRPYLDLAPVTSGPNHARAFAHIAAGLADRPAGRFQAHPPAGLRRQLIREAGLPGYFADDPEMVPTDRRSHGWARLCARTSGFGQLTEDQRTDVVTVCNSLGYYRTTLRLLTSVGLPGRDDAALRWAAVGRQAVIMTSAWHKTRGRNAAADIERVLVAVSGCADAAVAAMAALHLLVHHAKLTRSVPQVAQWAQRAGELADRADWGDEHSAAIARSAAYRGIAYRGFLNGDDTDTDRMLDLATQWAYAVEPTGEPELLRSQENLRALTETKATVAQQRRAHSSAVEVHRAVLDLDPFDSRVHAKHGDLLMHVDVEAALVSYLTAVRLGTPALARAWTGVGECHRRLGRTEEAMHAYAAAVDADPLAVSALVGLRRCAEAIGQAAIRRWAMHRIQELRDIAAQWHQEGK